MGRRQVTRAVGTAATMATLFAAGCGSDDERAAPTPPAQTTAATSTKAASAKTPVSASVVEAGKQEGRVVVYTNANEEQTAPLVAGFEKANPGINVRVLSLNGDEVVQRYLNESASGGTTNAAGWRNLVERGALADYEDPNVANLPDYAKLADGVVAVSMDPMIAFFNKAVLPEARQPNTLAELAEMSSELKGKIATTNITTTPQAYEATAAYVGARGDAGWRALETLGPNTEVESSTGSLITKLAQGQYAVAFLVPGSVRPLLPDDLDQIVNSKFLSDATVVVPRGIGLMRNAAQPNAAKVFLNYALSVEGQQAACEGGLAPYRDGVTCEFGLTAAQAEVDEGALPVGSYGAEISDQRPGILDRWRKAFGR